MFSFKIIFMKKYLFFFSLCFLLFFDVIAQPVMINLGITTVETTTLLEAHNFRGS